MTALYHRLSGVGFPRTFVRSTALPEWWQDEAATTPAGYSEALLYLARHFGLSLATLQDETKPLALRDFGACKFKKTTGTSDDELALARVLGTRTAQLAATAAGNEYARLPASAREIRLRILDRGAAWVGLREVVNYCWDVGIPVVFLARLPKGAKKMHGMTAMFKGRPIIVLAKNIKPTAWLLFILAHELGHIASGHLREGEVLLDQNVDRNEPDSEEDEANTFALELITGDPNCQVHASGRWPNADELASVAKTVAQRDHIDPGHVVLNYAHTMGTDFWPVANTAIKKLEPDGNGPALVRTIMAERLDWSALPKESSQFLMRVTRAEP